jgi:mono/diheme cytochrome c family protein
MTKRRTWLIPAILGWLNACTPASPGDAPAVAAGSAQDVGARIYGGNCLACHQPDARGIPGVYPSLVGSPVVLGDPKAFARWVVKGQRAASMQVGRYYSTTMPQFGWLKASDAAALLTYLRSNFGNAAPRVAAATVAEALGD